MKDLWYFEKEATQKGCKDIAGIDEAGRGPLAGPAQNPTRFLNGKLFLTKYGAMRLL